MCSHATRATASAADKEDQSYLLASDPTYVVSLQPGIKKYFYTAVACARIVKAHLNITNLRRGDNEAYWVYVSLEGFAAILDDFVYLAEQVVGDPPPELRPVGAPLWLQTLEKMHAYTHGYYAYDHWGPAYRALLEEAMFAVSCWHVDGIHLPRDVQLKIILELWDNFEIFSSYMAQAGEPLDQVSARALLLAHACSRSCLLSHETRPCGGCVRRSVCRFATSKRSATRRCSTSTTSATS